MKSFSDEFREECRSIIGIFIDSMDLNVFEEAARWEMTFKSVKRRKLEDTLRSTSDEISKTVKEIYF